MANLRPSQATLQQARNLATINDTWMTPLDDKVSEDAKTNFGLFEIVTHERWEETCHFDMIYATQLRDMGYEDAYAQGFKEEDHMEAGLVFHEEFFCPLKEAFWEEWGQIHQLYKFWQQNIQNKNSQ